MYKADGDKIVFEDRTGDSYTAATCPNAVAAATILNRAARENDRNHYTASARLHYKAESLPGFKWQDGAWASEQS